MSHAHLPILVLWTLLLASCGGSGGPAADAAGGLDAADAPPIAQDHGGPLDVTAGPETDTLEVADAAPQDIDAPAAADGDATTGDAPVGDEPEIVDGSEVDGDGPEIIEPFVCEDDASCLDRVEVTVCARAACVAGHCVTLPDDDAEGSGCDDGDACTTGSLCKSGLCTAGVPLDCSSLTVPPCTFGVCDGAQGGCVAVSADEETPCDDGDPCTEVDLCQAGACLGISSCDDGDICNGIEGCDEAGECTDGTPLVCESDDPCLGVPACDALFGCVLGPPQDCGAYTCAAAGCLTSCDDHDQCVDGAYCEAAACVPALPDGSVCWTDAMCASDHCGGTVCCAEGQCCTSDAQCPLGDVAVLASQETATPQSGFARVVITPMTAGLQTFVAPSTGVLERVDLMLQTPAQEGYLLEVKLWESPPPDEEGAQELTTTNLVVVATTGEPTVWTAVFDEVTTLLAGQTYGVSASWLQGDPGCEAPCAVIWVGGEDNPYPDGVVYRTYDSGGDWELSDWNDDLWFRVWTGQHSCTDNMCQGGADEP